MRWRMSHVLITQDIVSFIERPQSMLSCVKFWQQFAY